MKKIVWLMILTSSLLAEWKVATVIKVIDGDTIVIRLSTGESQKARLIGFDTPESYKNKKLYKQASRCSVTPRQMLMAGDVAKSYTLKRLTRGVKINYIDFGVDYFRRSLIWIDGFNYRIVADGYAKAYRRADLPRSIKASLRKAELDARKQNRGIWSLFDKNARCY